MDRLDCHAIYVDKRARQDRYLKKPVLPSLDYLSHLLPIKGVSSSDVRDTLVNLKAILAIFPSVHLCTSGTSCLAKLRELDGFDEEALRPIIVILETSRDLGNVGGNTKNEAREQSTSSPLSQVTASLRDEPLTLEGSEAIYGLRLLQLIASEISDSSLSKLVIPVAMISGLGNNSTSLVSHGPTKSEPNSYSQSSGSNHSDGRNAPNPSAPMNHKRMMKYFELGAVDVLTSPLCEERIAALVAHAYRAHKDAIQEQTAFLATKRLRKRSWVGVDEEQPYAYLREAMVSTLMNSICKPDRAMAAHEVNSYNLTPHQRNKVANAIGRWNFSAHDFKEDELLHTSFLILKHATDMPELGKWRLSDADLTTFIIACRAAYNGFVLYHNFQHVVDVLQAVFFFLLQVGVLPPYPARSTPTGEKRSLSPIAAILTPFDALTLLISAIGHDVGHPGVNNAFLVALKAPLAQLYNDSSVLEAFHCAAYSQILRRYWTVAFDDTKMRQLLITTILATDMGVHFKYMSDLAELRKKLAADGDTAEWSEIERSKAKTLACGLLIKCADISNAARPFKVAAKWADILQLEFAKQGEMEKAVGIETTLFGGPPVLGDIEKLGKSQIGFIGTFAKPLFESVSNVLPDMNCVFEEILQNCDMWDARIQEEMKKQQSTLLSHSSSAILQDAGVWRKSEGPLLSDPDPDSRQSSVDTDSLMQSENRSTSTSASADAPRRSSAGNAYPPTILGHTASSFPYPPSVAFSTTNIPSHPPMNRRSSNAVPSALHLDMGRSNGPSSAFSGNKSSENSQPLSRSFTSPSGYPLSANYGQVVAPSTHPGGIVNGTFHGGSSIYRSEKGSDGDSSHSNPFRNSHEHFSRPLSHRTSTQPSTGRFSSFSSSQDRYSNTTPSALTSSSTAWPYSPTETQATSFLTDGSDIGTVDDMSASAPDLIDLERPGTGRGVLIGKAGSERGYKMNEVKTSVSNLNVSPPSEEEERVIRRKGSRFRFDFWKRKGREVST
ncbi:MAG: 3',5'-cyclic-nucleotide phosphodiesterase [Icmadophila ericetorum]|nr:3',5'-cyclic-nucleotide phosphodiesterase [Icmadophila ericetorum]